MRQSQTKRSLKREVISRIYNVFVKVVLSTRFSDAQCGFKALSRNAVETIIPQVEDQAWSFDTELLRQYAQTRVSASFVVMLLVVATGVLFGLWKYNQ